MKGILALCMALCMVFSHASCSENLTDQESVIALYQNHQEIFLQAALTGDYSGVESLRGVQKVNVWDNYVDIPCGGAGFGSSTHYYGIFYSPEDDLCAVDVAGARDQLVAHGEGYLYCQPGSDDSYYVQPLGNHFYYYEAHF